MITDFDTKEYEIASMDYEALLNAIRLTTPSSKSNQKFGLQIIKPKEKEEIKSLFNEDKLQPYQKAGFVFLSEMKKY